MSALINSTTLVTDVQGSDTFNDAKKRVNKIINELDYPNEDRKLLAVKLSALQYNIRLLNNKNPNIKKHNMLDVNVPVQRIDGNDNALNAGRKIDNMLSLFTSYDLSKNESSVYISYVIKCIAHFRNMQDF